MKTPVCEKLCDLVESHLNPDGDGPSDKLKALEHEDHVASFFIVEGVEQNSGNVLLFADECFELQKYAAVHGKTIFYFGASDDEETHSYFAAADSEEDLIEEITAFLS